MEGWRGEWNPLRDDGSSSTRRGRSASAFRRRSPSARRARSRSSWRPTVPWRSPSPRQSQSRRNSKERSLSPRQWRSPSRRRSRSRSPHSTRPSTEPSPRKDCFRRSELLAEKVMSMAAYKKRMQDPRFRLRTMDAGQTIAPIPMPLSPGGNVRDYQERFEFWLAQRNVTLSSLRGDPLKERCYRHNFAQWRLRMSYDQPANSKYGSAATATCSPPRWHSRSPSRQRKRSESSERKRDGPSDGRGRSRGGKTPQHSTRLRVKTDERAERSMGRSRSQAKPSTSLTMSTRSSPTSQSARCSSPDGNRAREASLRECCCEECGRRWSALNRRITDLEDTIARLGAASGLDRGVDIGQSCESSSSRNDRNRTATATVSEAEPFRGDSTPHSRTSTLIDLTDDVQAAEDVDWERSPPREHMQESIYHDDTAASRSSDVEKAQQNNADSLSIEMGSNHERSLSVPDTQRSTVHQQRPSRVVNTRGKSCPIETYNRLNDQILLNEKVEEDSLARMAAVIGEDKATAVELRSQIYELRASIKIEKNKRDAAVAAVIAHDWEKKHEELALKLETLTASSVSIEHQDWHEECAAIAVKLEGKDKELAALSAQFKAGLASLTSLLAVLEETNDAVARRRLQKLSSQIGLEQASRAFLETERQMVFMRILKSSRQIQTLVKTQLGKINRHEGELPSHRHV